MAKEQGHKPVAQNRKARHDYHIEDTWEAGMVLQGTEVKSLRAGRASLVDGFADRLAGESPGLSGMGAVVGATEPRHIERLRSLMPRAILLIPGVGAQGRTGSGCTVGASPCCSDSIRVQAAFTRDAESCTVSVSDVR